MKLSEDSKGGRSRRQRFSKVIDEFSEGIYHNRFDKIAGYAHLQGGQDVFSLIHIPMNNDGSIIRHLPDSLNQQELVLLEQGEVSQHEIERDFREQAPGILGRSHPVTFTAMLMRFQGTSEEFGGVAFRI